LFKEIGAAGANRDARTFFIDQQLELRILSVRGALEIPVIGFPVEHIRKRSFLFCIRDLKCQKPDVHFYYSPFSKLAETAGIIAVSLS
jgi:hypothetical protein